MKSYKSMWPQQEVDQKGSRGCDLTFDLTENNFQGRGLAVNPNIWKDNGKIQEPRWLPLLITHGICHLSRFYGFAALEWLKCVLVINLVWEETWGKRKAGAGRTWPDGRDGTRRGLLWFGQFISTRWWRLPHETDASFVMMTQNQSEALPRPKSIKGSCECMNDWLDGLATQIKSRVAAIGRRRTAVISRSRCREAFLRESCIPLQTTHTLTFAHRSARKEIPEAHFQFMQKHHGKTDPFQFN